MSFDACPCCSTDGSETLTIATKFMSDPWSKRFTLSVSVRSRPPFARALWTHMKQATYCECFIASSVLGPDKARFGRELLLAQLVCLYIVYNSDPSLLFVEVMCELLSWKPKGWLRENWQQYTVALAIKETQGILICKDSIAAENHNRNGTAWTWTELQWNIRSSHLEA